MDDQDIDLLIRICDLYGTICNTMEVENKLDKTMIMDTLLRLKSGEKEIRNNPEW